MNINSKFDNINSLNTFLHKLNEADWKSEGTTSDDIKKFIINNRKFIANQKNDTLHNELMQLSDRINKTWSYANNLSFEIMGIAKGVLDFKGEKLPELWPAEMWGEILSHLSSLDNGASFYPSKEAYQVAKNVQNRWTSQNLISLKCFEPSKTSWTAQEAVEYAIKNHLTGVNLSSFPDLTDKDLENLFSKNPDIKMLQINSNFLSKLPQAASKLISLNCDGCKYLESLPEFTQLQKLSCKGCKDLKSLPELPQLQELNCWGCKFTALPKFPKLQWLDCSFCNLEFLPELPQLITLNCHDCNKLQTISGFPELKDLDCNSCNNLKSISEVPKLRSLDRSACKNLKTLPTSRNINVKNRYY